MIIISSSGYVLVGNGSYLTGLEQTRKLGLPSCSTSPKQTPLQVYAIDSKLTFLRLDHQHRGLGGILIPVVSGYIFYKRKQYRRLNTDPGPRPMVFKSDPSGHAR
ncbi:hypothetical protein PAXINDRAFT_99882 [Paxillus involutus ATCC 200175]|uniref:Uncharacterized protein n=1 Tax=Paxillus involutus ATCC 200175 TaxID=664439 RepID=A0A0C9TX33_PAXIN|nr:hypothetical protein PAXINDRAFT_99882 [Paxillus involutus ATCC 200175]